MAAAEGAFAPDLTKWAAWHPDEVADRLAGVAAPWCIAAGWALDLFLGEQRRDHEDIEIAVPGERFLEVARALDSFDFFVPGDPPGLVRPRTAAALDATHQTWVREPETELWRLDVFREPSDGDTWICRRDQRVRLPYSQLIERTPAGIPFARPEVVLLFKAKAARSKDERDLDAVLPSLDGARTRWLAGALALVHPGHPWLRRLH